MNITVYVKSNCVQCTQSKKLLDKLGLEYQTVDVEVDMEAYDFIVNRLGYKAAPVIVVTDEEGLSGKSWSGFDPEKIKGLLND